MVYLITYDLNKQKNYDELYRALKGLGEWARDPGLDSVWFISTTLSAGGVFDRVHPHMDNDDKIAITQMEHGKHQGWLNKDLWDWINARL